LTSKRQQTRGEVIKHILKYGNPLVIASDVNPAPRFVEKIAASLGSKLFYPELSLLHKEKEKIVEDYEEGIKSAHEKDALAAALKAFKNYHGLFVRVEKILEKEGKKDKLDELISVLLASRGKNIAESIKSISKKN
jgi:uncharacterized protein